MRGRGGKGAGLPGGLFWGCFRRAAAGSPRACPGGLHAPSLASLLICGRRAAGLHLHGGGLRRANHGGGGGKFGQRRGPGVGRGLGGSREAAGPGVSRGLWCCPDPTAALPPPRGAVWTWGRDGREVLGQRVLVGGRGEGGGYPFVCGRNGGKKINKPMLRFDAELEKILLR